MFIPYLILHHHLQRFCAVLVMLASLVNGLPAQAAELHGVLSHNKVLHFDQNLEANPWNSFHLLLPPAELTYSLSPDSGAGASLHGYNWEGPPAEYPDWHGIKRDTFYFVALQFAAIAVLYVAPESLSGWTEEDKDNYSLSKWWENITHPIWDEDEWWVNYILHPYWGATYYIRGRERGLKRSYSFWYSFLLSSLYEFGAEALFEPVSIQDLIVTPVAGALIGEYIFTPIRENIRAKTRLQWTGKIVLFITDPLGVVSDELSRIFGLNTHVDFHKLKVKDNVLSTTVLTGPEIAGPARTDTNHAWGLHMKIIW